MKRKIIILILPLFFFLLASSVFALRSSDIDGNGVINQEDIKLIFNRWLATIADPADIDENLKVNSLDLGYVTKDYGKTLPTSTPYPTSPPSSTEWTQFAHDPQRTGYTPEEPRKDWTFAWHWQPDDMSSMPRSAHAVTGGSFVYLPGGSQGLYAVKKDNGTKAWQMAGSFIGTPAYDPTTGLLYAGATNGRLYKINPAGPNLNVYYDAGSAISQAVLLVGNYAYVTTDNGQLHKINTAGMSRIWMYSSGSKVTTPPSYSDTRKLIIFGTQDINIHAVYDDSGILKWKTNPSGLSGGCYSYEYGWPVVADVAGVVLIRMRLEENSLDGPGDKGKFPNTNQEIKDFLNANADHQPVFALNLDDGSPKFTPAVGNGGIDDYPSCAGGSLTSTIGTIPAIKTLTSGKQVAYLPFRNGQTEDSGFTWDGRWDSHMGEMVLANQTVGNYTAGDMRFVQWEDVIGDGLITDEMSPVTVAGNTIFYAHWGYSESHTIKDRSDALGSTRIDPITTDKNPSVIRRITASGSRNDQTRYTSGGLELFCDGRYLSGPGFWVYWNQVDPPAGSEVCSSYGDGMRPRYTFVSDGKIYIIGNGGDIFALKHS